MSATVIRARRTATAVGLTGLLIAACAARAEQADPAPTVAPLADAREFDAERAWGHLEALVAIGPRPPAGPGAARVRDYLDTHFAAAGAEVHHHVFTAQAPQGEVEMRNVWAEVRGTSDRVLLISAHRDTKVLPGVPEFIGANDSASGLAVLLALADAVGAGSPPPNTVWFVAFDGEESYGPWSDRDGVYGSRAFVEHLRKTGTLARVDAVLNLDMVGDEHLRLVRETQSTPWLMDRVWDTATRIGLGHHLGRTRLAITDDHVPFLRAGIPAANVIDLRYGPRSTDNRWWHTRHDTLAHCRPASLRAVGSLVLRIILEWSRTEAGPPVAGESR